METKWRILKIGNRFYPQRKKSFLGIKWWSYETQCCGIMDTQWSFSTEKEAKEYIDYKRNTPKKEIINV